MSLNLGYLYIVVGLLTSIVWGSSVGSFFSIWVALELNMFAFLGCLMSSEQNSSEALSLKYFLVQALGSSIFLGSVMLSCSFSVNIFSLLIFFSLLLKLGGAPMHGWFVDIITHSKWDNIFLLSSLQKILPLVIICNFLVFSWFVLVASMLSLIFSVFLSWQVFHVKMLFGYSSVFNLGWFLAGSYSVFNVFVYLVYYSFSVFLVSFYFFSFASESLLDLPLSWSGVGDWWLFMLLMLMMGGVPPLLGFWGKFWVLFNMWSVNVLFSFIILISSIFMLYNYLRIISSLLGEGSGSMFWGNSLMGLNFMGSLFFCFNFFLSLGVFML